MRLTSIGGILAPGSRWPDAHPSDPSVSQLPPLPIPIRAKRLASRSIDSGTIAGQVERQKTIIQLS